ncbi:MAG TPA: porin [Ignavibacteriaceae bacterium]|nr:porin [Ignavibacteriaceae bacterium]
MKNNTISRFLFGIMVFFIFAAICVNAQDSKIPGGDLRSPLSSEMRNGKLVFESEDGDFRWWFDSRIQVDGAIYFENKNAMSNGAHFRRLTFAIKSVLFKNWEAEVDVDFAEQVSTKSQVELRDMWIKYTFPTVNLSLQVGHFKEPFGMERLNSSRLLTFLERSATSSAFPMGRRIGASARYWNEYGQVTAAIMGHEAGTRIDKGQRDEGFSTNLRLSAAPINKFGHNWHIGVSGSYKVPDAIADLKPNTIEINARTESYVFNPKFLHTGDISDVNHYNRYGAEFMYIYGPLYFQTEYMGTTIKRWYDKPTVNLKGGYALLAFMLTGENRYYFIDEGEVGPIEAPKHSWGAVELAARYSILDLNHPEAGVRGGRSNQLMFGLNYYPNTNIKIQANYSLVYLDEFATRKGNLLGDDDHSFLQFRVQASL